MNYLQLTNDFLIETQMEDQVSTLASIQDDVEQASVWIRDAWLEIQRKKRWNFRWAVDVFATTAGKRVYTLSEMGRTAGDEIDLDQVYVLNGTEKLDPFDWRASIGHYDTGTPQRVGQRPDEAILLDPIPDEAINIVTEYFRAPQVLIADDNEPYMDPSFHKAIVWKAIQNYAREQGNEWRGLYEAADREFADMYGVMLHRFLSQMVEKVPLVR